jgi:hypothetical protein
MLKPIYWAYNFHLKINEIYSKIKVSMRMLTRSTDQIDFESKNEYQLLIRSHRARVRIYDQS